MGPWGYSRAKVSNPLQTLWAASWWPLGYVRKGESFALLCSSVWVVYVWYCSASVGSRPSVLSTCAILEPAVPRFRAQEEAAFSLTVHQLQGAQFRRKGCCGPLSPIQLSCHGFSSGLFSCYAKQNSKHRCLTRMSCGLFGIFLINISSEHCFVVLEIWSVKDCLFKHLFFKTALIVSIYNKLSTINAIWLNANTFIQKSSTQKSDEYVHHSLKVSQCFPRYFLPPTTNSGVLSLTVVHLSFPRILPGYSYVCWVGLEQLILDSYII